MVYSIFNWANKKLTYKMYRIKSYSWRYLVFLHILNYLCSNITLFYFSVYVVLLIYVFSFKSIVKGSLMMSSSKKNNSGPSKRPIKLQSYGVRSFLVSLIPRNIVRIFQQHCVYFLSPPEIFSILTDLVRTIIIKEINSKMYFKNR